MKLKAIQNKFHEELDSLYPIEEVDSFFGMLAETYYGVKRIQLATNPNLAFEDDRKIFNALNELKQEKPIQYILGETEFYGMPFQVNEGVLIPRPETEELVEWVLKKVDVNSEMNILDMGTGSGCIAIALAKHLPKSNIHALDISTKALKVARENAKTNRVDVSFYEANILALGNTINNKNFDIIVSNPPYVREKEKQHMKPNVVDNEPHLALFVKDEDPLLFYKAITDFANINLKKNGLLFFEINEYLGKAMIDLLTHKSFKNIELKQDIFKKDRMIKAEKAHEQY
ncbi:peptide chain release factor N(5)-glutamine methyltransferase [Flavisericum labens]|uniref:peptide chain release factor N(5)-glutamine methyltransferase n=1 Tax=Flavisericum labens TaxID=3377112 RepID=UPI00387B1BD1